MIRGDLIERIISNPLNDEQINLLRSDKWNNYINSEHDVIIFADKLFDEEVEILQSLCSEMGV